MERDRPLRTFRGVAEQLSRGELQRLDETALVRRFRTIAHHINAGIEKVSQTTGTVIRKPENLDQILGETPERESTPFFGFASAPPPENSSPSPSLPKIPSSGGKTSSPADRGQGSDGTVGSSSNQESEYSRFGFAF